MNAGHDLDLDNLPDLPPGAAPRRGVDRPRASSAARSSSASIAWCANTWRCSKDDRRVTRIAASPSAILSSRCARHPATPAPQRRVHSHRRRRDAGGRVGRPGRPAPAVLLVHSYMRSHADWDVVAGRLHEAGLRRARDRPARAWRVGRFDPVRLPAAVHQRRQGRGGLAETAAGCAVRRTSASPA